MQEEFIIEELKINPKRKKGVDCTKLMRTLNSLYKDKKIDFDAASRIWKYIEYHYQVLDERVFKQYLDYIDDQKKQVLEFIKKNNANAGDTISEIEELFSNFSSNELFSLLSEDKKYLRYSLHKLFIRSFKQSQIKIDNKFNSKIYRSIYRYINKNKDSYDNIVERCFQCKKDIKRSMLKFIDKYVDNKDQCIRAKEIVENLCKSDVMVDLLLREQR